MKGYTWHDPDEPAKQKVVSGHGSRPADSSGPPAREQVDQPGRLWRVDSGGHPANLPPHNSHETYKTWSGSYSGFLVKPYFFCLKLHYYSISQLIQSFVVLYIIQGNVALNLAGRLYNDLKNARPHLAVDTPLHLLYLVTPYDLTETIYYTASTYYKVLFRFLNESRMSFYALRIIQISAEIHFFK